MAGFRRIALVGVVLTALAVGVGGVKLRAQTQLADPKDAPRIFASTCSACHRSPQGLAKSGQVAGFLRQHYTTGPEMSAAMAAYLVAAGSAPAARKGAAETAQKQKGKKQDGPQQAEHAALTPPAADAKDQPLAETFFAARATGDPRLPTVGAPPDATYLADSGFIGATRHAHWQAEFGAHVVCPPYRSAARNWPPRLRTWLSHHRQIIESVNDKLLLTFRLERERPHELSGFHARLAAKVALHNFCCWLNRHLGRPTLAFADLLGW